MDVEGEMCGGGECSESEFLAKLSALRTKTGANHDPQRFFTGDDELIRSNGETYALSNQWGGEKALGAVRTIAAPARSTEWLPGLLSGREAGADSEWFD